MKLCQTHWDELKKAIHERGLGDLIQNSEGLREIVRADIEGIARSQKNFDPLFAANMMIWNNALRVGGFYMMGADEHGNEYCPVCEAEKHGQRDWIKFAADGAAQTVKELPPD